MQSSLSIIAEETSKNDKWRDQLLARTKLSETQEKHKANKFHLFHMTL
jgi:hypothetical protein